MVASVKRSKGNVYNLKDITNTNNHEDVCLMGQANESWLWHKRLRNLNFDNLVKVSKHQKVRGMPCISKPENVICEGCQHGKQTKESFPSKEYFSSKPLQLVHTNLCGPTTTM